MAHAGKEIRFPKVGFLRHRFGVLQLMIQAFAFGDVARGGEQAL